MPGTLARIHVVLRSSLSQAMRWGWIWDNPAERAHRITSVPKEIQPPTPIELRTQPRGGHRSGLFGRNCRSPSGNRRIGVPRRVHLQRR
jgi:hypothetical protein